MKWNKGTKDRILWVKEGSQKGKAQGLGTTMRRPEEFHLYSLSKQTDPRVLFNVTMSSH